MENKKDGVRAPSREMVRRLRTWQAIPAPPSCLPNVLARAGLCDAYSGVETPVGPVFVAYNDAGIAAVMRASDGTEFEALFRARFGRPARPAHALPPSLAASVRAQVEGKSADLRFDLHSLTVFERTVLLKALEIPRGEVRPYWWVAREIGHPRAMRAVGSALAGNPVPLLIPCHRVVRGDGHIGNYVFGGERKRAVLAAEGAAPEQIEALGRQGVRFWGNGDGSFCLPTCGGMHLRDEPGRRVLHSLQEALAGGYRPCRDCRPAV